MIETPSSYSPAVEAFFADSHGHFINGESLVGGESTPIINPCDEAVLCTVPEGDERTVDMAIRAARDAFTDGDWSQWTPAQRQSILWRLADLVERDRDIIAEIEALNAGKAISGCKAVDIDGAIDLLRYMAGWATKIEGATKSVSIPGEHFAYTLKEPIGVVGAVVPWNWPFNMAIWKLAAPLAVGCTVVLKPAQITPLSMLYFSRLCEEAGLPPGVVNIVLGRGSDVGEALVSHSGVDKVSFTGSTPVGINVGLSATRNINPVTLELGGKSPMLVFDDAEIEAVVDATQQSIFFNTGQVCSAGSRLYVHRSIHAEVVEAIAKRAAAMVVGDVLSDVTEMGPAISKSQRDSVNRYIELGTSEGAELVCGGVNNQSPGYWLSPTIFDNCKNEMRVVQEEIFGPVLVVIPFDSEAQAIALANDNEFGLAASVFTRDIGRAQRVTRKLEAGTVWINTHDLIDANTPFGGVKKSGYGKDLGPEQLEHFLNTKSVWCQF